MDECLIAVEETMATGQEIAFQPPLAKVLGQHLHHSAIGGKVIVANNCLSSPCAICGLEDRGQAIGRGLIGSHQAEPVAVAGDDVAQKCAEDLCCFSGFGSRLGNRYCVVGEVWHVEVTEQ